MILLYLALICFVFWFWRTFIRRQLPGVPTPKALPIIGHMIQLGQDPLRPFVQMFKWAQECGDVYSVRIMSKEVLFINSYRALHETLVEKGKEFSGRPRTLRACVLFGNSENEVYDIAMRTSDEYWSRMRQLASRSLKYHGEEHHRLEALVTHYCNELLEHIGTRGDSAFDISQDVYNVLTAMMYTLVFGVVFKDGSEELNQCKQVETVLNNALSPDGVSALLDEMPWLRYFNYPAYQTAMKAKTLRDNLYKKFTKEINVTDNHNEMDGGLYDLLHKAQSKIGDEAIADSKVHCILTDITVAGLCTTANTMSALLALITMHQDVQAKMREEIDNVLGNMRAKPSDKERLPYTRAVVMETTRLFCVAPISLPHMTIVDTSVCGYNIPKGTTVMMNIWAALHDEQDWPEPMKFKPERFLTEDGLMLPPEHERRKRLLAFGAGPRQCLGEELAKNRLLVFTTAILQQFTLHLDPTQENETGFDPCKCEMNTIVLAPSCKMIAKPRL